MKGQPWYKIPEKPVRFTLDFQPPLAIPQEILDKTSFPLKVRALNQFFQEYYQKQLGLNLEQTPP
jgi:hypothetical protein